MTLNNNTPKLMEVKTIVCSILLVFTSFNSYADALSPIDYGLQVANTGYERYEVLLQTHIIAIQQGKDVSYKGIKRLSIDIPINAKPIPLPDNVDFAGVEFVIRNNAQNCFLFCMKQELKPLAISKRKIKSLRFSGNQIKNGSYLLVIEDKSPWVKQRAGYKYGAIRKDILLIDNKKTVNTPIYSYSSKFSRPSCSICKVDHNKKTISDLTVSRDSLSTFITNVFLIENQNNVVLRSLKFNTPRSSLYDDGLITINNCTNISFDSVVINGTYATKNRSGYGIAMNNVWNVRIEQVISNNCEWGVFGNSNINTVTIANSDINRFDIHCYGRNVLCKKTTFRELYNQVSSFYGYLTFEDCTFIHSVPLVFESSYNAYTPFKLSFVNCSIVVDSKRPYLINSGYYFDDNNKRKELSMISWPSIEVRGLNIVLGEGKDWFLFYVKGDNVPTIDDCGGISIDGLKMSTNEYEPSFYFSNKDIRVLKKGNITIKNSNTLMVN